MLQCPNCGIKLTLALVAAEKGDDDGLSDTSKGPLAPTGRKATFRINKKSYTLSDQNIYEAAKNIDYPATIRRYYVELPDRKGASEEFPIKQVVRQALRAESPDAFTDETYFTAHRARDILKKLGFEVKERY